MTMGHGGAAAEESLEKKRLLHTLVGIIPSDVDEKSLREARLDTRQTVMNAFLLNMDDYADAAQLHISMDNAINLIVTRNRKDFRSHIVAIQTPQEFLQEQEP